MTRSNKDFGSSYKQNMRLCLINFSCNSTQTSCGHNVFKSRIKDPTYFRIEKNSEGVRSDEKFSSARKYMSLHCILSLENSFIVDVGHSSTAETLYIMSDIKDFHDNYDFFVITVIDSPKLLRDSLRTIKKLIEMGVPKYKLKTIFSKFKNADTLSKEFYSFLLELKKINVTYNIDAAIKESEVYEIMSEIGINFSDLNKEESKSNIKKIENFKNKKRKKTLEVEEVEEIKLLSIKDLAHRVSLTFEPILDNVFELLFPISNENR